MATWRRFSRQEKNTLQSAGVGHYDEPLKHTYRALEVLLGEGEEGKIYGSDASGWDLSVSAATFLKSAGEVPRI